MESQLLLKLIFCTGKYHPKLAINFTSARLAQMNVSVLKHRVYYPRLTDLMSLACSTSRCKMALLLDPNCQLCTYLK